MRTFAIVAAASATVLACGSAFAADLRVRAPAAPAAAVMAPIYDWNGFYIGIQGGYGWGNLDWTYVATGDTADHRTRGGLFGGTAGMNFQAGNWVFGLEGDYAWARIQGSAPCPNPAFACRSRLESFGTVRGRIGMAWDSMLIYGTGGLAFGEQRIETFLPGGAVAPSGGPTNGTDIFRLGWTAGGGVEWGFAPGWSAKIEALYFDLGRDTYTVDNGLLVNARHDGVIVRGGINYRFNWGSPAPVVARH